MTFLSVWKNVVRQMRCRFIYNTINLRKSQGTSCIFAARKGCNVNGFPEISSLIRIVGFSHLRSDFLKDHLIEFVIPALLIHVLSQP